MTLFGGYGGGGQRRGGGGLRLIIGVIIILIGVVGYFTKTAVNPTTGEKQRVGMTEDQETRLGLQAAPQMAAQMGGEEDPRSADSQTVERIGQYLVSNSFAKKSPYTYDFHLLSDRNTINAFALPGGQIFITRGLFERLKDEAELAGVLGHEIGHVVERHSAQQMAKGQLGQMIVTGVGVAGSDRDNPYAATAVAQMVNSVVQLRYGRQDESESDADGLRIMTEAGFDPRAMIDVMNVLAEASKSRGRPPEFLVSHPYPENRIEAIERWLREHPDDAARMTRGRTLR